MLSILLILIILITLSFDYVNGFHDTANAIATCVSTRALSAKKAIIMAAVLNFIGAIISTKVASTIGTGIIETNSVSQMVILAGVLGAVIWGLITWYFAIPSSSSHALIGGIMGAAIANSGFSSLHWLGIRKIFLTLLISPIIGILAGFALMVIMIWLFYKRSPYKLNQGFRKLQILSAAFMAFSHGTADAQKSMGIITMALVSYGLLSTFVVPPLVMITCAIVMGLGTAVGGWRIIKTIGKDFVRMKPIQGFCVETASAGVILGASAFGLPTSTTHVLTAAILGSGLTKKLSDINWKVALRIFGAMIFTIPAASIISFIIYVLSRSIMQL